MRTACILIRGVGHQLQWGTAFAAGLERHGVRTTISRDFLPSDLLVMWGVRRANDMARQRMIRGQICVLERGYVGDRMKWTSVSFGGGLNGRGEFHGVRDDPTRFEQHHGHLMLPWRGHREKVALLIGQVPGDMSLVGADMPRWYSRMVRELNEAGYRVLFREHPRAVENKKRIEVQGARNFHGTLPQALAQASLCATYNSNTAVEAVLAGVPTITEDIGSMAWEVTSHDVESGATFPDRRPWAARLAWKQWTEEEMRSGKVWEAVNGPFPGRREGQGSHAGEKGSELPHPPETPSLRL